MFEIHPSLRAKLPGEIDKGWILARKRIEKWLERNGYESENYQIPKRCLYTYQQAMEGEV